MTLVARAIKVVFFLNSWELQDRFDAMEHVLIKNELFDYAIGIYLEAVRG